MENQWAAHGKDRKKASGASSETLDAHLQPFANVLPSVAVDLLDDNWFEAVGRLDLLVCCNVLHVSPWACSEALFEGAGEVLRPAANRVSFMVRSR